MARKVYMHIGAPKTGTTFLQQVMGRNRDRLAAQGVLYAAGRYPGDRVWATEVLRGLDHSKHPKPYAAGAWTRVLEQVHGWDRTAVVSHEFFGACDVGQARRALVDLAPAEVHVVFTARDYVRQVAAAWQERLKFRHTTPLSEFTLDEGNGTPIWSWRTQDVVAILDRWGRDLPPEHVHVVTVPQPGAPGGVLWERFADVIGVDPAGCDTGMARANTSLGATEAELLRRVNEQLGDDMRDPVEAARWVRDVLANRILAARVGDRFGVPSEAARPLRERSVEVVERLRARGYDVVGDLSELVPPEDLPTMRHPDDVSDAELLDAATDTIASMLRYIERQARHSDRAERSRRAGGAAAPQQQEGAGRHRSVPESARQALIDLSERRPALMRARAGYRRTRNAARRLRDR